MEGYRLSPQQKRLWFLQRDGSADSYYAQVDVEVPAGVSADRLGEALNQVSWRHEILRTVLRSLPGADIPLQVIEERPLVASVSHDLSRLDEVEWTARWAALRAERAREPFDVATGPLLRADFAARPDHGSRLLLTLPAGCADTVSLHTMAAELRQYCVKGAVPGASSEVLQYADAAEWQLDLLAADETAAGRAFWERRSPAGPLADPLRDGQLDVPGSFVPAAVPVELGPALVAGVRELADRAGVPVRTVALAGWQILFQRIGGDDILIALVGENRPHEEMRGALGAFAQYLPFAVALDEARSFRDVLADVDETARELLRHQQFRDATASGGAPLARLAFEWLEPEPEGSDDGWRLVDAVSYAEPFWLRLSGVDSDDRLDLTLHYNASWLPAGEAGRLVEMYVELLADAVAEPSRGWTRLSLTSTAERELVLASAGATPTADQIVVSRCIHEIFEEHAASSPDAPAVVAGDGELTYRELNERANQLGHWLRGLGVRPDMPVGLLGTRSVDFVVGLLGIMKAGGAYLPLDPAFPAARRSELLAQAGARIVVADPGAFDDVAGDVTLVDPRSPELAGEPIDNPVGGARPANLAYVIFTSGSTGVPKGVGVSHGGLAGYVGGVLGRLGVGVGWRFGVLSGLAADLGHTSLFGGLCSGGVVCVVPGECVGDAVALAGFFERFPVDCLKVTPSHVRVLLEGGGVGVLPLRVLVLGGEGLDWELVGRVRGLAPGVRVVNHYGPTEATVGVLSFEVPAAGGSGSGSAGWGGVPLGWALGGARVLVLDEWLRPVPVWVRGEVFVGGSGLARGYLGCGGLTGERFVPDPWGGGGRLYRTGDRARRLVDGSLVFEGRVDDQVKVRGFRVEPGEVAGVLRRCPGVREAVVVAQDGGGGGVRLVAYGVWGGVGEERLRAHCVRLLPDYMVPSVFVGVDRLPLLASGKVDRRALPAPVSVGGGVFEGPVGVVEELLASVWAGVLGVDRVGRGDDFFALGGDSILSIQVVARAARVGLWLTPKLLFRYRTVAGVAPWVRAVSGAVLPEQGVVSGGVVPTPVMVWFLQGGLSVWGHYNQAVVLRVRGGVLRPVLRAALAALVVHHDALRLRLSGGPGSGWRLGNAGIDGADCPGLLTVVDRSAVGRLPGGGWGQWWQQVTATAQAGIDLDSGCLLRAVLLPADNGDDQQARQARHGGPDRHDDDSNDDSDDDSDDRLLLIVHHLAVDGVSWPILLEDLETAYRQAAADTPIRLPAKTTPFRTWAQRLHEHAHNPDLLTELPHWTQVLSEETLTVPEDVDLSANTYGNAAVVSGRLDAEKTDSLLRPGSAGVSAFDTLLAALARTLADWTGKRRVVLELEGHGRSSEWEDIDVSRTVGWFTTQYPFALDVPAGEDGEATRRRAHDALGAVPGDGLGYGLLRYGRSGDETAALRALPQPRIRFNYLGQVSVAGEEDALFTPAPDSTGPTADPLGLRRYLLDVTAIVVDGHLQVDWIHCPRIHPTPTVETLSEAFLRQLSDLLRTDTAGGASGPRPEDFPLAQLDAAQLEAIAAQLGGLD
jgi:amino acid adenylation domain-containing protein/non-ribosomal peptide synthase protein (TIGR01720 family)